LDFLKNKKFLIDYYCNISKEKIYGVNDGDFNNHLLKQFNNSDLIIISSRYFQNDLKILDELIKILKQEGKKIIIFDNALEQKVSSNNLNRLDHFFFLNNRYPNKVEINNIEKDLYSDLKNKKEVNFKINEIQKKNKIYIIKRENIFCDVIKKSCPSITEEGYKIYWDYGHITNKGAEFFARRIEKDKLFLEYLNSTLNIPSN
jgi:hypothetical protein